MKRLIQAIFLLSVCPALVVAEPERGRLPDGRAFRTDVQGNQLVDYIAELEVSVETLNRTIKSLEEEVRSKDQKIARLETGRGTESLLIERSLVGRSTAEGHVEAGTKSSYGCEAEQQSLKELQELHQASSARLQKAFDERGRTLEELKTQLSSMRSQQLQAGQEKEQELDKVAALQVELSRAKAELENQRRGEARVIVKQDEQLSAEEQALPNRRPRLQREVIAAPYEGRLVATRNRAIAVLRDQVLSEVEHVRQLVRKRDDLFKKQSPSAPVALKPSRPVTSRNHTLQIISRMAGSAASIHQLNSAARDVAEIRTKIEGDIEAVERIAGTHGKSAGIAGLR